MGGIKGVHMSVISVVRAERELVTRLETVRGQLAENIDQVDARPVFAQLGGGLLHFAGAAFPGADITDLHAAFYEREPDGRGPHFDVYEDYLHENYPWLAVYNLSGASNVRAVSLDDDLSASYKKKFPRLDQDAYAARRSYAEIAFADRNAPIATGRLEAGMGMIILQRAGVAPVVHEVTPVVADQPGAFIKLVHVKSAGKSTVKNHGMLPLDELVTGAFGTKRAEAAAQTRPASTRRPTMRRGVFPEPSGGGLID